MPRLAWLAPLSLLALPLHADPAIPHLQTDHGRTQLIVDGQPFLIRGGEVGNSTGTNGDYLAQFWSKFDDLHLNTLLVPAYWDLIEPAEGRFDFSSVDTVLRQAREHHQRIVFLWFGTWKNSMSCYVPAWIKQDPKRFPRALDEHQRPLEILSPFEPSNLAADVAAYRALLAHLRDTDHAERTVILMQVENEIGMIPCARDHSAAADRAFQAAGQPATPANEETFMARAFAAYTEQVAAAGKKEYPLPTYVNAALIRPGYLPGQYPAGGPLPHLYEIWHTTAPDIDLQSPDIYHGSFSDWARRYHRPGNALFIPESQLGLPSAANGYYAYGELDALGFSVFAIESASGEAAKGLGGMYRIIQELTAQILAHQGRGELAGLRSEGPDERQARQERLGDYTVSAVFDAEPAERPQGGGLVIQTGSDDFLVAGSGVTVTFALTSGTGTSGILSAEEGHFDQGRWTHVLWLGGDQTNQGRWIRLEPGHSSIQKVKLYRY